MPHGVANVTGKRCHETKAGENKRKGLSVHRDVRDRVNGEVIPEEQEGKAIQAEKPPCKEEARDIQKL